jgi:hypothetical protein
MNPTTDASGGEAVKTYVTICLLETSDRELQIMGLTWDALHFAATPEHRTSLEARLRIVEWLLARIKSEATP